MDLMTACTTPLQLKSKYQGFAAPTARVLVGGKDLGAKYGTGFADLTVDLTSGCEASGCSFDVVGEYDPAQSEFSPRGAAAVLQLGAKVEIQLGYVNTETVFCGLIAAVSYEFPEDGAPYLHVECMDPKCLLMKNWHLEVRSEKKVSALVRELLSSAPLSAYVGKKSVQLGREDAVPLLMGSGSDYDFLVQQAQYFGCEFFFVRGDAYFRPVPSAAPPIMTLTPRDGIFSASMSLQGTPLVQTVAVTGVDPQSDKAVSGSAALHGRFGSGSAPRRMLNSTRRDLFDARVTSTAQAQRRAQVLLDGLQQQFGQLQVTCRGLPEIVPGRYIQIRGLCRTARGSFYITRVRHALSGSGFTTTFDARMASL